MILLDTHVLLWQERGDRRMGPKTRQVVEDALLDNQVAVSAISFWEIGMLIEKDRLAFRFDLRAWRTGLLDKGLIEIQVNGAIAADAALLLGLSGDPADRIVVATALRGHRLITADQSILAWPGPINRMDASQ